MSDFAAEIDNVLKEIGNYREMHYERRCAHDDQRDDGHEDEDEDDEHEDEDDERVRNRPRPRPCAWSYSPSPSSRLMYPERYNVLKDDMMESYNRVYYLSSYIYD